MKQKLKERLGLAIFIIVALMEIFLVVIKNLELEFFIKPLIIPALAFFYLMSVKKVNYVYITALLFSFLGDVILLHDELLLIGICSFLITHLIYSFITKQFIGKLPLRKMVLPAIFFVFFLITLILIIKDNLRGFLVPNLVYGFVVGTFGVFAFINSLENQNRENFLLFLGAFSFIISNSFIALNKFSVVEVIPRMVTMLTYMLAQYLICKSMILRQAKSSKIK